MRVLSFIWAMYVVLLLAAPAFMTDKCMEEHTTEQAQGHDQHCHHPCSPFMKCHTCSGFIVSIATCSLKFVMVYQDRKVPLYQSGLPADFSSSIWQPPRLG